MGGEIDWTGPRSLRLATAASFLPAFPLCVAHGVISHHIEPAIGLVPLAVSGVVAVYLARPSSANGKLAHPAIIFSADVVLASALMVTLVFTWVGTKRRSDGKTSMLAAYATIPLLVNFLVHLLLSVRAIYIGLALDRLVQWVAWQAVPGECPNCNHGLRPSLPTFPWFSRARDGYARLFVQDDENRYRDEEAETVEASPHPPAVEVVGKRPKGKGTSSTVTDESSPWP